MNILDKILELQPGSIVEFNDRLEISHDSGRHSTVWLNSEVVIPEEFTIGTLCGIYGKFDGMDLFSSTFKVASVDTPKGTDGVILVPNVSDLRNESDTVGIEFPNNAVPFMIEAGIGMYAIGNDETIYKWDEETNEVSPINQTVCEILEEWLSIVDE